MREIKFRAWNKEKKIMVYKNEDGSSCFWDGVIASSVELINTELNSEINQSEYEFMQYTGLKDKNGVEIYEGDILQINYKYKRKVDNIIALLKYSEKYAQFIIVGTGKVRHEAEELGDYVEDDIEVIGNIYDNPELIEKEGK